MVIHNHQTCESYVNSNPILGICAKRSDIVFEAKKGKFDEIFTVWKFFKRASLNFYFLFILYRI
jgi:hypothetical protein